MTPDRWERVSELFEATLQQAPGQRSAFLSRMCVDDGELIAEVESLIRAHEGGGELPSAGTLDSGALLRDAWRRAAGSATPDPHLGTTVANLGMSDTRFPKPVFHGDTIRSRTTVKEVRDSKSRPNAGIVTFLHQGFNQRGEEVCTCTRQGLMLRKPA